MEQKLHLAYRNLSPSETLEQQIRDRVEELETVCGRIVSCRVVLEGRERHPHPRRLGHLHVEIAIPGADIVVDREPANDHEDPHALVRVAFDIVRRQLEDKTRRLRG